MEEGNRVVKEKREERGIKQGKYLAKEQKEEVKVLFFSVCMVIWEGKIPESVTSKIFLLLVTSKNDTATSKTNKVGMFPFK